MDTTTNNLPNLFLQLGLTNEEAAIEAFIREHSLPDTMQLHEAPFWSASQKHFLVESFNQDAQWSEVIDQLDTLLRKP
ncbi:DUF2789 domain-containing protein [Shewanella schlegeliana]|uniref:DUF2789 domain-containing protein n=1 Tax=Shewanella schlegeliana TaxID=190308 RepID=A0ABS1T1N3_9GAMM|nr:DUF2789 domain-containing protein [Shewanella schlegeliana]MBL4913446.1 DUF2789 domain-containing protein [Shewanella schlegeliana]MCL1108336.1 DUF2789 domain-containing protein [Shewanella schlegeliana]GIU34380.1 DUF2789 domain-containing protein [Shewanella schlegeliana]